MAEAKEPAPGKKIIDVAHPDTSAPSETSKPVIVTHHALLQDPMVVQDSSNQAEPAASAPPLPTKSSTQVKLRPIAPPAETTVPEAEPEPATDVSAESPAQPSEAPATATAEPVDKPGTTDEPAIGNNTSDKAGAKQPVIDLEAEAAAEAEKDAKLQQIVDSKQYFLPINSVEKRRTKRVIIVGVLLSMVLTIAWADIALDASLIHITGIKPVTHFFSN